MRPTYSYTWTWIIEQIIERCAIDHLVAGFAHMSVEANPNENSMIGNEMTEKKV